MTIPSSHVILNIKVNFPKEFKLVLNFFECADNGEHFKIVGIKKMST